MSKTTNKWDSVLTEDDLATYDQESNTYLNPEQRKWLEWGRT